MLNNIDIADFGPTAGKYREWPLSIQRVSRRNGHSKSLSIVAQRRPRRIHVGDGRGHVSNDRPCSVRISQYPKQSNCHFSHYIRIDFARDGK